MRAITIAGYGNPAEVLRLDDISEPTLTGDQVLVRVHAAALNPADWHLVRGIPHIARLSVGLRRPSFAVPGSDFAGVVEAVGPAITSVAIGDQVYGTTFMAGFGAFAERIAVPEHLLAPTPASLSFEEAAAVPLAATTALQALRDHGHLEAGQRVLVIGASGGVGTFAVQLARHLGAEVTGVSSGANTDLVRSLGADHVLDYTAQDITRSEERYDLVLELAGAHPASQLRRLLTPTGALVQLSGDSPNRWFGPLGRVVAGRLGALRSATTVTTFTVAPNRSDLETLASMIDAGALRVHLDRTATLTDVSEALERLEAGHTRGKVAISVRPTAALDRSASEDRGSIAR